ncbi:pre-mRNA-processing factor 40 homolog B [Cyclospora cayetanensis]|uniref:Pre-mRNA-processing factor 40 homolog B n=1 Tax=Cyclospora cayetanensis TaxID=88456 RepID=A0A6P6S1L4_9EIME|nr:pre-mRNA-processing factor 40 homolog B [Cyclospora cayetanensis]
MPPSTPQRPPPTLQPPPPTLQPPPPTPPSPVEPKKELPLTAPVPPLQSGVSQKKLMLAAAAADEKASVYPASKAVVYPSALHAASCAFALSSFVSELAKNAPCLPLEHSWGPMHFFFRGAPFQAFEAIEHLAEERETLQGRAQTLERQLKEESQQHQQTITKFIERQQRLLHETSQRAIKVGTGIAKLEGTVSRWRMRQLSFSMMLFSTAWGRCKVAEEVARTRWEASQRTGLANNRYRERSVRLLALLLCSFYKKRLAAGIYALFVFSHDSSRGDGLLFPGIVDGLSDDRTRLALTAMAQAKQDAAVLRNLVEEETAHLEAERLYLSRWRNQLYHLSQAVNQQAVDAIVEARLNTHAMALENTRRCGSEFSEVARWVRCTPWIEVCLLCVPKEVTKARKPSKANTNAAESPQGACSP